MGTRDGSGRTGVAETTRPSGCSHECSAWRREAAGAFGALSTTRSRSDEGVASPTRVEPNTARSAIGHAARTRRAMAAHIQGAEHRTRISVTIACPGVEPERGDRQRRPPVQEPVRA
jgi:hypothetical protein